MKILNSLLFDFINKFLFFLQNKFSKLKSKSFLLSNIDFFILLSFISVYIVSIYASNNFSALFTSIAILLTVLKVLITKGEKIELESCNFYLIIYLLICLISNITSYMPIQGFYGFSKTLLYIGFYFALCQFLKTNKKFIIIILATIGILVAFESVIGLIQNVLKVENIATWQDKSYLNPEDIITRVYGTLKPYNPNLFGGWLIAGISSLIGISALFFIKHRIIPFVISLFALFLSVLCIFYTGCRGAYIGLFAMIICFLSVLFGINKYCKIVSVFSFIMGIAFILSNKGILNRLMSIFILRGDSSTSFRMNVYNSSLQMLKDNFILGIGSGNKVFREIYGLYMLSGFDALSCYSVFLEIAVESGIFALITFLIFLFSLLKSAVKQFINLPLNTDKILIFTAFLSISGIMIHGLVDTVFFRPQIQFLFWTMVSIIVVLSKENKT